MRRSCCPPTPAGICRPFYPLEQRGANPKARDSQLAPQDEAAARELSGEQQLALVRAYEKDNFVDKGNVEIWAGGMGSLHQPVIGGRRSSTLVDHRQLQAAGGIDKIPSVHLGPAASQKKAQYPHRQREKINRQMAADNKLLKRN